MIPAAIALEMTECDVVKRAGLAERVEIGSNERGERTATLTYLQRPAARHLPLHRRPPEIDGARAGAAAAAEAGEAAKRPPKSKQAEPTGRLPENFRDAQKCRRSAVGASAL